MPAASNSSPNVFNRWLSATQSNCSGLSKAYGDASRPNSGTTNETAVLDITPISTRPRAICLMTSCSPPSFDPMKAFIFSSPPDSSATLSTNFCVTLPQGDFRGGAMLRRSSLALTAPAVRASVSKVAMVFFMVSSLDILDFNYCVRNGSSAVLIFTLRSLSFSRSGPGSCKSAFTSKPNAN